MWKKIAASIAVLLAILAGAVWFVFAHLDHDILTAIERDGSAATGTNVTVESVHLSLVRGHCVIYGLTVGNPPGFSTPYALSLGTITLHASTRTLIGAILNGSDLPGGSAILGNRPLMIDQVDIAGPHIFYEISGEGTALSLKSLNLDSTSNLAALRRGASKRPDDGPPQKQIIRSLDVTNGRISIAAALLKGRQLTVKLPEIHLSGIGAATGGATTGQVAGQVLTAISNAAALASAASLLKAIGSAATFPLGGALDKLKTIF